MKRDFHITEEHLNQEVTVALRMRDLARLFAEPSGVAPGASLIMPSKAISIGEAYEGGEYGGITLVDEVPHELILLPGEAEKLTHAEALDWAKKQGGVLPSRFDGLVLHKNLKDRFKEAYYWLEPQLAGDADYAWCQTFGNGFQFWNYVCNRGRARAVRRKPIR